MAFRKSNSNFFTSNSQKSKSKGFFFNKCLQMTGLTKNLFNCKSNSQHQLNYEYLPYESNNQTNTNTTMQFSNHPATSTMIESQENLNTLSYDYNLISAQESTQNEISIERQNIENECLRMQYNRENYALDNYALDETEKSRSFFNTNDLSVTATQNSSDYEMVTIVPINNSPLSDFKNLNYVDDTRSNYSFEYLHSTKISSVADNHCSTQLNCSQCQANSKSPLSSTESSINLNSPLLSSSSITPDSNSDSFLISSNEENEIELQLKTYQSMISNLSTTLNDEENNYTHICTSNYEATFVDDISIHFADTVRILRNDNDEWLYVQVASDGRQGFVPKTIILDLKQFIDQLKQHHTQVQIKAKRSI